VEQRAGRLALSHFRRVKQLGTGDVGLVDLVELQQGGSRRAPCPQNPTRDPHKPYPQTPEHCPTLSKYGQATPGHAAGSTEVQLLPRRSWEATAGEQPARIADSTACAPPAPMRARARLLGSAAACAARRRSTACAAPGARPGTRGQRLQEPVWAVHRSAPRACRAAARGAPSYAVMAPEVKQRVLKRDKVMHTRPHRSAPCAW